MNTNDTSSGMAELARTLYRRLQIFGAGNSAPYSRKEAREIVLRVMYLHGAGLNGYLRTAGRHAK